MSKSGKSSNHPIYPRPVSPLQYEPVYIRPEEVLWEQDPAEETSENDEKARAAKRRRIEKLGEAYLRGEELVILSAGIRGPLGEGWVNPWKTKKRRKRTSRREVMEIGTRPEIPETVERRGSGKEDGKRNVVIQKKNFALKGSVDKTNATREIRSPEKVEAARKMPIFHDPFIPDNEKSKERRSSDIFHKETWLKKDSLASVSHADIFPEDIRPLASPSTRVRQHYPDREHTLPPTEHDEHSRSKITDTESSNGRAEKLIKKLRKRKGSTASPINLRKQELSQVKTDRAIKNTSCGEGNPPQADLAESAAQDIGQDLVKSPASGTTCSVVGKLGEQKIPPPPAEILLVERSLSQIQDQNTEGLSAFDVPSLPAEIDARPCPSNFFSSSQHLAHPERQKSVQDAVDAQQSPRKMLPPSTLSTETSSTTVVSMMPSAQVAPTFQAPPIESMPSTGDKLSEQDGDFVHHDEESSLRLSTQNAIAAAQVQLQKELTTPAAANAPSITTLNINPCTTKPRSKSGITPFSAFNKPNHISTPHDSLNTQDLLNAVTPYDLATTVKKFPLTIHSDPELPNLAANNVTKKTTRKIQKRASFAPDTTFASGSSQGSIKASLKVSKHATIQQSAAAAMDKTAEMAVLSESTGPSKFGKLGLDMETSPEDADAGASLQADDEGTQNDLIATSVPRPTNTLTTTTSSKATTGQDAQKIAKPISYHSHDSDTENTITRIHDTFLTNTPGHNEAAAPPLIHAEVAEADRDTDGEAGNENFDLSAAMDEVGSFLQSWDTEKEIKELHMKKEEVRRAVRTGDLRKELRELRGRVRR
jgi:hypothetical protein